MSEIQAVPVPGGRTPREYQITRRGAFIGSVYEYGGQFDAYAKRWSHEEGMLIGTYQTLRGAIDALVDIEEVLS